MANELDSNNQAQVVQWLAIGTPQRLLRAALMPRGSDAGSNFISVPHS